MITDLRLQSFRSYDDASFEFSPGVNIIVGPNASGKTNLLEAILVLARGSSYRVKDSDLIAFTKPWARLDAHQLTGGERTLKLIREPASKTYEIDEKVYRRLSLTHSLPVVLFEPNHLQLLTGSPERRREYLDDLLEQTTAGYGGLRRQYKRTLAQRNRLLKGAHQPTVTELFPWNVRLSQLAGQIVRARQNLTTEFEARLSALYKELAQSPTDVHMQYVAQWPADAYESQLLHKLEVTTDLDYARGFTGNGPHRDDVAILFNEHVAGESASRGETRTLLLTLKIMELEMLSAVREQTPLLLLDDVFSELDGARRRALTEHLSTYQTFITTTDADIVAKNFSKACNVLPISK